MHNDTTRTGNTNRLESMDALRGVAIILVIYCHVTSYWMHYSTDINNVLAQWRMPLFFFVSGFFAYSANFTRELFNRRIKNRLSRQLYPTVIVFLTFVCVSSLLFETSFSDTFGKALVDPNKKGYWFTYSLVQVFAVFALMAAGFTKAGVTAVRQTIVYLTLALILTVTWIFTADEETFAKPFLSVWNSLSIGKTLPLVSFFFLGVATRINQASLFRLMSRWWFTLSALAVFVTCYILLPDDYDANRPLYFISRLGGMSTVVSFFILFGRHFDQTTRIGRWLQRVGRNTLPIYLFHFFILILGQAFVEHNGLKIRDYCPNALVELAYFLPISIILTEFCLFVDSMLRRVPIAHKAVFAS